MEHDSDLPDRDLLKGYLVSMAYSLPVRRVVNGFLRARMARLMHASSDIDPRKGIRIAPRIKSAIQPVPDKYR